MKQYKHYSFDLWGTLIKPNPTFKEARLEHFYDHYNPKKISHDEIEKIFSNVAGLHNSTGEITGIGFTPIELYTMVLCQLGYTPSTLQKRDVLTVYSQMETLFLKHLPFLYPNVGHVLENLKYKGCTISILSNTGFASGRTMRTILDELGIFKFFLFPIFSDEQGMSKPNHQIFDRIFSMYEMFRPNDILSRADTLHVGDSVIADINGANGAGLTGFGVHFNDITLKNILQ